MRKGEYDVAISIVTMVGDNYGSALQNYALQQAIQECGADSKPFAYDPKVNSYSSFAVMFLPVVGANS